MSRRRGMLQVLRIVFLYMEGTYTIWELIAMWRSLCLPCLPSSNLWKETFSNYWRYIRCKVHKLFCIVRIPIDCLTWNMDPTSSSSSKGTYTLEMYISRQLYLANFSPCPINSYFNVIDDRNFTNLCIWTFWLLRRHTHTQTHKLHLPYL